MKSKPLILGVVALILMAAATGLLVQVWLGHAGAGFSGLPGH